MGIRQRRAAVQVLFAVLLAAVAIVGCGSAGETSFEPGAEPATEPAAGPAVGAPTEYATRPLTRVTPWRDPNAMYVESHPAGAHLSYFGGRVVSNVHIVQVIYGAGTYASFVTSTSSPSMPTFYAGVTNSKYFDWLSEYDTPASGGTNQQIGRGTYGGQFTITPSQANDGSTIDDSNIQAELVAQIVAGNLPAPTADAAGNNDTLYMVHFPKGKKITLGGSSSCVSGGFCAYHGTIAAANGPGGKEIYYGTMPDMESGSGCDVGCGNGTPFGNQTSVASHEMIETVTDCEVGLATAFAAPLAWYDQNLNQEIGDLCNGQQGSVVGGDGVTYTVQQEFSDAVGDCIVTRNDFSLSLAQTSFSVQRGTSGGDLVSTAVTFGDSESVSLSIGSSLPKGVTASFSPSSVASGSSSTLTFHVPSAATPGSYPVTVKGTAASGSHTVSMTLVITTTAAGNDFGISLTSPSLSVAPGAQGTDQVNTTITAGSNETVAFSISGLPAGTTGAFSPASVASGNGSTLTVTVGGSTAPGTYSVSVTGTAQSGSHSTTLSLTVSGTQPSNDFSIAVNPGSVTVARGSSVNDGVSTAITNGSAESVALSATGLPSGTTASFSPTSVTSGGSSTLTIHPALGKLTQTGTFTVTVTGTAASGSHSTHLILTVQ